MKKIFIILTSFTTLSSFAQEEKKDEKDYDRWSFEISVGQNKAVRPYSDGYYSSNPKNYFNFGSINHFDFGVRHMFNPKFGLKIDFGYDKISNQSGSGSLPFEIIQHRIGLSGVVNIGRVLQFESFTNRFGLIGHGGIQVAQLTPQIGINKDLTEDNGGFMLGLSPQFRFTNWLVLTGDFSLLSNVRQHFNWDGTYSAVDNNLSGIMYNTSLGITVYIGKHEKHADWYIEKDKNDKVKGYDEEARKRLDEIETLMNDTDKDGVPDYLDQENNTPSGIAVDTRGKYIDINKNGVPDELERKAKRLDQNFDYDDNDTFIKNNLNKYQSSALKSLIENKNVNVYFDVNKDTPNSGSTNSVQQIYQYLMENPEVKIKLVGYADLRGDEKNNRDLSNRRAQKLKSFLVESGITESRINIGGEGVDTTFPTTKTGLDLARRVSVIIE